MCPAAGITPLRVAPEDVEMAEAGNLVKDLGVFNQAKGLIKATNAQMPRDLRIAMQRREYVERSKRLDADEVLRRAQEAIVEEGGKPSVIRSVLGARVRASEADPFDGAVVIQYETPEGRVGRVAVLHNPVTFPRSVENYNQAVADGKVKLPGEMADVTSLREALAEAHAENARLAAGTAGGEDTTDPFTPPSDEVKLPEGVDPGDPGYPVGEDGELLVLPDSVRDELIASHEKAQTDEELLAGASEKIREAEEQAAATVTAQEGTTWPEDLSTVPLPPGNADELKAGMPFFASVVVAALAQHDSRSTVQAAATAELESRPDKPAVDEATS